MFIIGIIFSIIIGYLFKGNLKNLENINLNCIYLAFAGFFIEAVIIFSIRKGIIVRGTLTLILDIIMYILLFSFTYANRKNIFLVIMGAGFLLNALAIFSNGGAMPVSAEAMAAAGLVADVNREGLYVLVGPATKLSFLCDVIPFNFISHLAISIGDIITAIGLMTFIITSMKTKKQEVVNYNV